LIAMKFKINCAFNSSSNPILTCKSMTKVKGQYVFETEKKNTALDNLLHEIQSGIKLKPTKTNDRSRPVLDGLRKFRRQMTIEEQIQKSESKAVLNTEVAVTSLPSPVIDDVEDELDDIDRVRDDLQSTKQMLALELRNKEAQERENKRLLAKIANLEAELERSNKSAFSSRSGSICCSEDPVPVAMANGSDDVLIRNLKKESEELLKTSKQLERKYQDAAEQLDGAKNTIEEQRRLIASLERKLQVSFVKFFEALLTKLSRVGLINCLIEF
jgi:chromosome segregation ATPase